MKYIILILVLGLIGLFIKLRFYNWKKVKDLFKELSIVVCGKRGSGKDTLMSAIAWKKKHNSNVMLQKDTNIINLHEIIIPQVDRIGLTNGTKYNLDPSSYEQFNNITFISDSQVYFPNWDDSALKKEYPSLPIVYSLWRHLFNAPLHFNTQNLERLYKILREQAEDCIMCLGCVFLPFYCVMKVRYYERARDCIEGLKPIHVGLFRKGNPDYNIEQSKRWEIKDYFLIIPRYKINHDTHYFKKLIFKEN